MGVASHLFYSSNDTEKQTLHRRIIPSDEQMKEQQSRWNELADHLIADLRAKLACPIRTWLQGSYKFATQVRPPRTGEEFDIDLGVFVCWSGQAEEGPHPPAAVRDAAQSSILDFSRDREGVRSIKVPPKSRCLRIHYEGDFHIDIPCYHLDPDVDERTLATDDSWEVSDPKAIYIWFKGLLQEPDRAKVRRVIRYLKCWAGLKWKIEDGRPSSVSLTVLAAEAFSQLTDSEIGADDEILLGVLRRIAVRVKRGRKIRNPVNPSENLNRLTDDQWSAFCDGIDEFATIAESACLADNEVDAADQWSKVFAHFFPMPDAASAIVVEDLAKSNSIVRAMIPDVMVVAVSRSNPNLRFEGRNAIGPIPKDCDIRFELVEPWNLPSGTTVEWIVRNEGGEAENVNDLGHRAGVGYIAKERSAYNGLHFMDCVMRNNERMFGLRRVPVRINGIAAPRRNPLQRPGYVKLMGRR